MSPVEYAAFWITVFAYMLGTALALCGLVFARARLLRAAGLACGGGLVVHLVTVGARIAYTGHLPVASRYENVLMGAAVVMLFSLVTLLRRRSLAPMLVFVAPFALLMLGYALLEQPRFTTMSLVLDNLWMFVHIFFAWLAYGAYSVAAALGVVYLMRSRASGSGLAARLQGLPPPQVLDDLMFRAILFGFVGHVVMISTGAIWARDLWGSYWTWDPVETWSLLSGLLYGLWIHLRVGLGWRGRRMAWLSIAALLTVIFAFWGTNLFGGTSHSLDDLRLKAPGEEAGLAPEPSLPEPR
ncbi:MAG: cytochrome c biogenesis protein CcsA [Myxococcales bacterium]|nr:cytochrome c biogenesis protein CcsA [Myxococcales bacterium]MDH5306014.1 cytochrome c biogenesis protein CcsA [Myxococcales bacterium]